MKIAIIGSEPPFPPDSGNRERTYKMIKHLSLRHDLSVFCVSRDPLPTVSSDRVTFHYFPPPKRTSKVERVMRFVSMAWRRLPRSLLSVYSEQLAHELRAACRSRKFDVVIAEENSSAMYLRGLPRTVPRVVVTYGLSYHSALEGLRRAQGLQRLTNGLDAWAWHGFEQRVYRDASIVVVLSDVDRELLRWRYGCSNIAVIPNGADLNPLTRDRSQDDHLIVFLGNMSYFPNVEGATFFAHKVFPRIQDRFPSATFRIVGKDPSPEVVALARRPGIEVTGYVVDVQKECRGAAFGVAPIFSGGGGSRSKIMALLGFGLPSVCTTLGVAGVPFVDGLHGFIADDEESMAAACIRLLGNARMQYLMAEAALELASHLSWESVVLRLEELLSRIAKEHSELGLAKTLQ